MDEETQLKEYMVILWNDDCRTQLEDIEGYHLIKYFSTLKEALIFMMKRGALYDHQEIAHIVNWLPNEDKPQVIQHEQKTTTARVTVTDPEELALASKPNPTTPPPEQPVQIGENGKVGGQRLLSVAERLKMMGVPSSIPGLNDPE